MTLLGIHSLIVFGVVAAAIASAFFFKRRSKTIEVPAVTVWLKIGRPVSVRWLGVAMRSLVALLVQLVLIALLIWALTDPFPEPPEARRIVLVVDTSVTMQSKDEGGGTRFDNAVRAAKERIQKAPVDAEILVVGAGLRPTAARSVPGSPEQAIEDLEKLAPADVEGDLGAAVRTALFMAGEERAEMAVFSDFASASPETLKALWPGPAAIKFHPVGADGPAAAIVDTWCTPARGGGWNVGAAIASRAFDGRRADVSVVFQGASVARAEVVLDSAEPVGVEIPVDLPQGSVYQVRVDAADALEVDDWAAGVIPGVHRAVCLVTNRESPITRALRADPSRRVRVVSHDQFDGRAPNEVVIVDGPGVPALNLARSYAAGYLCIATDDPFGVIRAGEGLAPSKVTHWHGDHPALTAVEPDLPTFQRVLDAIPAAGVKTRALVAANDTPFVLEATEGVPPAADGVPPRMMYWLFDLAATDLPDRVSFPVLLWNTIDYLAGAADEPEVHRTGQPLLFQSPAAPRVVDPEGNELPLQKAGDAWKVSDTFRQGVYTKTGATTEAVAVNLLSERGLKPLPPMPADEATKPALAKKDERHPWLKPSWQAIVAGAMALALVEWLLFHAGALRIGSR